MTRKGFPTFLAVFAVAWIGCAPAYEPEVADVEPPAPDAEVREIAVTGPLAEYLAVQEALAADDLDEARAALERLAAEAPQEVARPAREAAQAEDLQAVRRHFVALSEAAVEQFEIPEGVVRAHCPMAHEDGASWLQRGEEIRNPYYGAEMLTCGEIVQRES